MTTGCIMNNYGKGTVKPVRPGERSHAVASPDRSIAPAIGLRPEKRKYHFGLPRVFETCLRRQGLVFRNSSTARRLANRSVRRDTTRSIHSFRDSVGLARPIQGMNMSNDNSLSLAELNDRIAVLRDNIRQLVEQAAASSGASDEERASGRIAQQQEELDKLIMARDALTKK